MTTDWRIRRALPTAPVNVRRRSYRYIAGKRTSVASAWRCSAGHGSRYRPQTRERRPKAGTRSGVRGRGESTLVEVPAVRTRPENDARIVSLDGLRLGLVVEPAGVLYGVRLLPGDGALRHLRGLAVDRQDLGLLHDGHAASSSWAEPVLRTKRHSPSACAIRRRLCYPS